MQGNIDKNNVVTNNELDESKVFLYAHYSNIKGMMLNRVSELVKNDEIQIMNKNQMKLYKVAEVGIINNVSELYKKTENGLYIITCSKSLDHTRYYIKAISS